MSVTIYDVAREAGVSLATASRALSGTRRVNPELVTRVQTAARDLGYRHNAVAKALRSQRSGTIGMVVPEISNPFFPAIVQAVERDLQASDRELMLCDSQSSVEIEARRIHALLGRQVDGLLVIPVDSSASGRALDAAAKQVAVVQIDRFVDGVSLDWVGVDDDLAMAEVVNHVCSFGASRIALVSAGQNSSSGRERLNAFRKSMAGQGLAPAAELLGEFSTAWGQQSAAKILAMRNRPDAVVCGNDEIALGMVRELRRHDVKIPKDVMVTGFDDNAVSEFIEPSLTTIHQPREAIATEATRLLDARLADPGSAVRRLALAPRLIQRDSTSQHRTSEEAQCWDA